MHGREDALLDAGRFPRLLRQANDAEVADVRKVGDDDYEISRARWFDPRRSAACRSAPRSCNRRRPPRRQLRMPAAPGQRENGQRFGVRFRRGSRAPSRGGEIPLIGVVRIEPPMEQPHASEPDGTPTASDAEAEASAETPAKRPRPRRPRKRAAAPAKEPAVASTTEAAAEGSAAGSSPQARAERAAGKRRNEPGPTGSHAARLFFCSPHRAGCRRATGNDGGVHRRGRGDRGPDRRDRGLPRLR